MTRGEVLSNYTRRQFLSDTLLAGGVLATEYVVSTTVGSIADSLAGRIRNASRNLYPPTLPNSVEANKLPDELPAAVAAMRYAAVAIIADSITETAASSGIILDPYHVLTAGHAFRDETGGFLPFIGCKNKIGIFGRDAARNAIKTEADSIVSIYQFEDYYYPDVSLVKTTTPMGKFDFVSPVVLNRKPIKKDEPLYFINYQSNAQRYVRNPLSSDKRLQSPAIFAGYAINTNWNGYIAVDVIKGYGNSPDNRFRPAGSGGPVFNGLGQLVGISNESAYNDREALVYPITPLLLGKLANTLLQKPDACHI